MAIANRRVIFPGGSSDITVVDVSSRVADIQFSFDGALPPSPGDNTSTFGICHTAGGIYLQGGIYYDTGSALTYYNAIATTLTTRTPIFGGLNLIENAVYVYEGGTWVQKIDHSFVAKEVKTNGLIIINSDEQRIVHRSFPVKAGGKLIIDSGGQLVVI